MTTETEYRALLEQALEALKSCTTGGYVDIDGDFCKTYHFSKALVNDASESIRAELAKPPTPAWHDAPTEPGLWVLDDGTALVLESGTLPKAFDGLRWYGPIPQDTKAEGEST